MFGVKHVLTWTRHQTRITNIAFSSFAFENERLSRELSLKNAIFECGLFRFAHFSGTH